MSGPENTWIAGMHAHLPPPPPPFENKKAWPAEVLYRMKNHNQYNGGIADVWYDCDPRRKGRDLWVEYKFAVIPKRDSTVVVPGLSDLQFDWLSARLAAGRNVAVIVGCKEGGVRLQPSQWMGLPAGEFRNLVESRRTIAEYIRKFVNAHNV